MDEKYTVVEAVEPPCPFAQFAVRITTIERQPNYRRPWVAGRESPSGGSGCIVSGNRILTVAHVVANTLHIRVRRPGDSTAFEAQVLRVDHERELALLTVADPTFFDGTEPARLSAVAPRGSLATIHGFKEDKPEIVAGEVAGLALRPYYHSHRYLASLQIGANVAFGTSGAPVLSESGDLIGLAFQTIDADDECCAVPITAIQAFLQDVDSGLVHEVPDLGIFWQRVSNRAQRAYLGLDQSQSGVLVSRVVQGSSADGFLVEGDVLTSIDGTAIDSVGNIEAGTDRLHFLHAINSRRIGETISCEIVRAGMPRTLDIVLRSFVVLAAPPRPDRQPQYLVFGGLIFTTLTYEYIGRWDDERIGPRLKHYYANELPTPDRSEIVLISEVLPHEINSGYQKVRSAVVRSINNRAISRFANVAVALSQPVGSYHVISLDNHGYRAEYSDDAAAFGTMIVLDATRISSATEDIISQYGVPRDHCFVPTDRREPEGEPERGCSG